MTLGYRDNGDYAGFFLPTIWNDNHRLIWWDTGTILLGSGLGYRHILDGNWWDQQWFVGGYGYYIGSPLLGGLGFNVGGEVVSSQWFHGALNIYGGPYIDDSESSRAVLAISGKIAFNLVESVKPFVAFSYAGVGSSWEAPNFKKAGTIGGGARWIINPYVNLEFKYLWGDKPESGPRIGVQFKFGDNKVSKSFFYNALYSPPERYIPAYFSKENESNSSNNTRPPSRRTNFSKNTSSREFPGFPSHINQQLKDLSESVEGSFAEMRRNFSSPSRA